MLRVEECLVLMALVCMCSSANVTDCTTLPAYSFGSATGQWSYNNEVDWGGIDLSKVKMLLTPAKATVNLPSTLYHLLLKGWKSLRAT
jgi:hypothetical protein